jgi:uncharacterized protein YdeI (YjbR/CyaY-like superfamily)
MLAKSAVKTFKVVLERTQDGLGWTIARIPPNISKAWGKRGQIRVKGEINGFSFGSTLFPKGNGEHFLLVNKKMQKGGKTTAGLAAKFRLEPDTEKREIASPKELLRELGQSRRLLKFYESLNQSTQNWISKWIADVKSADARKRRSEQIAVHLMETLEAERDLPPQIAMALRQNPKAHAAWEELKPSHRRRYLMAIFYYRSPESRARRLAKVIEEITRKTEKSSRQGQEEDWDFD